MNTINKHEKKKKKTISIRLEDIRTINIAKEKEDSTIASVRKNLVIHVIVSCSKKKNVLIVSQVSLF